MIQEEVSCSDRLSETGGMRHRGGNRLEAWAYLSTQRTVRTETEDGVTLRLENRNTV